MKQPGEGGQMAGGLVVVGVDGSAPSIEALRWAARYGEATGATIRAVRAWYVPTGSIAPAAPHQGPVALQERLEQEQHQQLSDAVAAVYPDGAPASVETHLAYGHSADALIRAAQGADLLVVGNKGRGEFTGMLFGSVSMHCVASAPCPVVVVKVPR
jgi:nucleotide-binding universal stress UspA family protein